MSDSVGNHTTPHLMMRPSTSLSTAVISTYQRDYATKMTHENRDLHYPYTHNNYSDLLNSNNHGLWSFFKPRIHRLTKENIGEVKILDFWGEGRIIERGLITGFPNSYNVNHQHQQVTNGPNMGKPIPNRIPTVDYNTVSIASFVADNTFQYVTLMGAPLIPAVAQEMYRVVRKDELARIILYGTGKAHILETQVASQNDFVHMHYSAQYIANFEPQLRAITLRPVNTMVPIKQVIKDLKDNVLKNNTLSSIRILKDLEIYCKIGYSQTETIITQVKDIIRDHADL